MTHSRLLARKHQKPTVRRPGRSEPISHAAITVTTIAGHCSRSIQSILPPPMREPVVPSWIGAVALGKSSEARRWMPLQRPPQPPAVGGIGLPLVRVSVREWPNEFGPTGKRPYLVT